MSKTADLREALIEAAINYVDHVSDKIGGHFSAEGTALSKAIREYRAAKEASNAVPASR